MEAGESADPGMILFPTFAILIWWPAAVYRRRWPSFAFVTLGVTVLATLGLFHAYLGRVTNYSIFVPVFQSIWIPYAVMVGLIGYLIALMPRSYSGSVCRSCGYPDDGLSPSMLCPECGRKRVNPPIDGDCALCGFDLRDLPRQGECPKCEGLYAKPVESRPKTGRDWFSGQPGGVSWEKGANAPSAPHKAEDDAKQQDEHRQARNQQPADEATLPG